MISNRLAGMYLMIIQVAYPRIRSLEEIAWQAMAHVLSLSYHSL
jgi:hypothetical protein